MSNQGYKGETTILKVMIAYDSIMAKKVTT